MKITKKHNTARKIEISISIYIVCLLLSLIFSSSIQAQGVNLTKNFGIGSQGATPAFGGMSFRYNGLAPVYLQTVGRFILNDQDGDHMLGAGISYAIFEHRGKWNEARLYFTLEGGWRYKTEMDIKKEIINTTTLAAGIAFGGELVFSLGGIPLGLNISIGQGIGRESDNSQSKGIAGVYVGAGIHAYF
ncbi:hypothetical protein C6501_15370 [Candidatus Poribacteria bacterium]|nr:MAG: hypothetical protein C6501_15370 [Candidatus Poribacteria bacterium]